MLSLSQLTLSITWSLYTSSSTTIYQPFLHMALKVWPLSLTLDKQTFWKPLTLVWSLASSSNLVSSPMWWSVSWT